MGYMMMSFGDTYDDDVWGIRWCHWGIWCHEGYLMISLGILWDKALNRDVVRNHKYLGQRMLDCKNKKKLKQVITWKGIRWGMVLIIWWEWKYLSNQLEQYEIEDMDMTNIRCHWKQKMWWGWWVHLALSPFWSASLHMMDCRYLKMFSSSFVFPFVLILVGLCSNVNKHSKNEEKQCWHSTRSEHGRKLAHNLCHVSKTEVFWPPQTSLVSDNNNWRCWKMRQGLTNMMMETGKLRTLYAYKCTNTGLLSFKMSFIIFILYQFITLHAFTFWNVENINNVKNLPSGCLSSWFLIINTFWYTALF